MIDLKNVSHYLKMEIYCDWEKDILILFQTAYLKMVLERFDIAKCNSSTIPIDSGLPNIIIPSFSNYQASFETILWYSLAIRSLIYVMTMTWPDIAFVLSIVSRYSNNRDFTYLAIVTQILWYIKDILYNRIIFCRGLNTKLDLTKYMDTNYELTKEDQKFTSSYLFCFEDRSISWSWKKEIIVALSFCKAKYIVLNKAGKEAI